MYEAHFGLQRRAFRPTPDCASYYPATGHERALHQALRALDDGEGLALICGGPGTGKTLLGLCLLDRLGASVTTALLTQGHYADRTGLLQALLFDLGLPYEGRGEQDARLALTDFLLKNYSARKRTVLVVDEAQHLRPDLLEELRLLGNLEGAAGKAVQVVLLAQPTLLPRLRRLGLAAFRQRLALRAALEPMNAQEAADYLVHQVRAAGGQPEQVFLEEALELLARGTGGIPRRLNQAAHEALSLAAEAGVRPVDAEAALEALARLGLEVSEAAMSPAAPDETGMVEETIALPETEHPEWRLEVPRPA
jgi:type II secretory pathway predicted ATPase ExeA